MEELISEKEFQRWMEIKERIHKMGYLPFISEGQLVEKNSPLSLSGRGVQVFLNGLIIA